MTAEQCTTGAPIHTDDCESWACNHCQVCGIGVLYGSRCNAHPMPGSSGAVALAARTQPDACERCGRPDDWTGDLAPGAPCMGCGRYPAARPTPGLDDIEHFATS